MYEKIEVGFFKKLENKILILPPSPNEGIVKITRVSREWVDYPLIPPHTFDNKNKIIYK